MIEDNPQRRPWFIIDGGDGDRTLEEQLTGLEQITRRSFGSSLLDLGCAEGLIAKAFAERGARPVHGIDRDIEAVLVAREQLTGFDADFFQADLNHFAAPPKTLSALRDRYDIVLALAITHKLDDPEAFLHAATNRAEQWFVFRSPFTTPEWRHFRRDNRPIDTVAILSECGFMLEHEGPGPRKEWTGIFRRA